MIAKMFSRPNYRALIGLGVAFLAAGIASSVEGLIGIGILFMILGVVKTNSREMD